MSATDAEAGRAIKVAEAIVEVLSTEADTSLAAAGLAMALSWLATTRTLNGADALQLVAVTGDTARQQTETLYGVLPPEVVN
jgi:hypothetical protein